MSDQAGAMLDQVFSPAINDEGTPEGRLQVLVSLHVLGRQAWWAKARMLFEVDRKLDWKDGHKTLWDWWCDVLEIQGFDRPEEAGYQAFQRQLRCGYLFALCQAKGIPADLLVRIASTKADVVYSRLKDAPRERLQEALEQAVKHTRTSVIRLLREAPKAPRGHDVAVGAKTDGGPSPAPLPTGQAGHAYRQAGDLDARDEPPGPAPIPADDRPPATVTVTMICDACGHRQKKTVEI